MLSINSIVVDSALPRPETTEMRDVLTTLDRPTTRDVSTAALWWGVFFLSCALYFITAQRDMNWQDSGLLQWRVLTGDVYGELSLAVAHPLLILAGQALKAIPVGTTELKMNFLSGVGMAVALANFTGLIIFLTGRWKTALLFAAMLGVSHTAWWLSTLTETYTWVAAGLTAELWLLARLIREPRGTTLAALAFINGLGLTLHDFALLPLPVYASTAVWLAYTRKISFGGLGLAFVAYLAGAALIMGMVVQTAISNGSLIFALHSFLFGEGEERVLSTSFFSRYTLPNLALASLSYLNPVLPLAILGWFRFCKVLGKPLAVAIGIVTFIEILFIIRYPSQDQFTLSLPALIMIFLAAAIAAAHVQRVSSFWSRFVVGTSVLSIALMPVVYGTLPHALRMVGLEVKRPRTLPYRDELRYWITPWKHNEHSAQFFAETSLVQAAANGVILSDGTALFPLLMARSSDPRYAGITVNWPESVLPFPDKEPERFFRTVAGRPLYVVSPVAEYMPEGFKSLLHLATFTKRSHDALYRATLSTP